MATIIVYFLFAVAPLALGGNNGKAWSHKKVLLERKYYCTCMYRRVYHFTIFAIVSKWSLNHFMKYDWQQNKWIIAKIATITPLVALYPNMATFAHMRCDRQWKYACNYGLAIASAVVASKQNILSNLQQNANARINNSSCTEWKKHLPPQFQYLLCVSYSCFVLCGWLDTVFHKVYQ